MGRTSLIAAIILVVTLVFSSSAGAGLVVTESDGAQTLISNNMLKANWDNGTLIMDANKNMIHFIDDSKKMISSDTPDNFCNEMKKMAESLMEGIPEEQKSMIMKMMKMNKSPKVELVKKGQGEKIAGYKTVRYEVMADGELYEQLWLAEDKGLIKECKAVLKMATKFAACMEKSSVMGAGISPETTPEYEQIYEIGVFLKSVKPADEESGLSETTLVEKKDIPDSEFKLPKGYKAVSFSTLWGMPSN